MTSSRTLLTVLTAAPTLRAAPEAFERDGWSGVRWTSRSGHERAVARHESGALGVGYQGLQGGRRWGARSADGSKAIRAAQGPNGGRGGLAVDHESKQAFGGFASESRQRVRWVDAGKRQTAVAFQGPAAGGRAGWRAVGPKGAVHAERQADREGVAWANFLEGIRDFRVRER